MHAQGTIWVSYYFFMMPYQAPMCWILWGGHAHILMGEYIQHSATVALGRAPWRPVKVDQSPVLETGSYLSLGGPNIPN